MPILAAEPDCFPPSLFGEEEALTRSNRAWLALHTKPRQEKSLARELHAAAIPYFLPLMPRRLTVRRRPRPVRDRSRFHPARRLGAAGWPYARGGRRLTAVRERPICFQKLTVSRRRATEGDEVCAMGASVPAPHA